MFFTIFIHNNLGNKQIYFATSIDFIYLAFYRLGRSFCITLFVF